MMSTQSIDGMKLLELEGPEDKIINQVDKTVQMKTIQNVDGTVTVRDLIPNVVLEVVDMKANPNVIPVLTALDFHIINVDLEVANMKRTHNVNATLTVLGFHLWNVGLEDANGIRIKTQDKPENRDP